MSYPDIGTYLFFFWAGGCWLSYGLSFKTNRDTRLIPLLFGIVITVFYFSMHGKAGHWHHWWYAWNAIPNGLLLVVAWLAPGARARWPLMVFSAIGLCVDAVYFGFAYSGHRLPGICYFCAAATIETLQVACMIYFSGPVESMARRAWQYLRTRKLPWTHQQRLSLKV